MTAENSLSRRDALKDGLVGLAALGLLSGTHLLSAGEGVTPEKLVDDLPLPPDARSLELKDLNGYFPMKVPATKKAWDARAAVVRDQMRVALGLVPRPSRGPIDATLHGTVEHDGYSVTKVYFESHPGLYVTGSLYRPAKTNGPAPAVLTAHGHWNQGRFHSHGDAGVQREIDAGAERFTAGGKHPLQSRCVTLARLGCVVFLYDMLGYADSVSISYEVAHRYREGRAERTDQLLLYTPEAEMHLLSPMGLQTFNSIRALDFLAGLDDVDATRIGMTGASGGGTQTMILSALDDRIAASFPAVMVSTAMQGGCTCENASLLRIDTGNIEFAALTAPRPLGLSAANDWTQELETKGLPELKRLYALLGRPENLSGRWFDFGHNFNAVSRQMMYDFFVEHLKIDVSTPIVEADYQPLAREEASVWNDAHPRPETSDAAETEVLNAFVADTQAEFDSATDNADAANSLRNTLTTGWRVILGYRADDYAGTREQNRVQVRNGATLRTQSVLHTPSLQESTEVLRLSREGRQINARTFWLTEAGIAGLFGAGDAVREEVETLLGEGHEVITCDWFDLGPQKPQPDMRPKTPRVNNPRELLGYTVGYNRPHFSKRVSDAARVLASALIGDGSELPATIIAEGGATALAAAALVLMPRPNINLVLLPGEFTFDTVSYIRHPYCVPGALRYGGLHGLLALATPNRVRITTAERIPNWVQSVRELNGNAQTIEQLQTKEPADALRGLTQ